MAQDFARSFYNSARWKRTREIYARSKFYLCEKCGKPYKIVHHKQPITKDNIHDTNITLSYNNLQCLCQDCHNAIHNPARHNRTVLFDAAGNVIGFKKE